MRIGARLDMTRSRGGAIDEREFFAGRADPSRKVDVFDAFIFPPC
jgi:hypothetical protein